MLHYTEEYYPTFTLISKLPNYQSTPQTKTNLNFNPKIPIFTIQILFLYQNNPWTKMYIVTSKLLHPTQDYDKWSDHLSVTTVCRLQWVAMTPSYGARVILDIKIIFYWTFWTIKMEMHFFCEWQCVVMQGRCALLCMCFVAVRIFSFLKNYYNSRWSNHLLVYHLPIVIVSVPMVW